MLPTPELAGIYCRLSYAPDGSVEKVERQEADCRELAARLSWPISDAHVFPDNSRSAWQRNRKRPQWDRMLKAIEAGEIDAIIVYHGDRLIRQPFDLEKLLSIADSKGIRLASPSGLRNLDSPDDRYILRIEAAGHCRESDGISRRVRRGHLADAAKGLQVQGGSRPFGFGVPTGRHKVKKDPATGEDTKIEILDHNKIRKDETPYITEAAERLLAGQSANGVARWLGEEGITTTAGNPWTSQAVWHLLLSPRAAGLIERGGVLHEAAWGPVISRETQEDLRALHERNREEHPNPGPARRALLSGGLVCGKCNSTKARTKPLAGKTVRRAVWAQNGIPRNYYCRDCFGYSRNVALLDAYVVGRTLQVLDSPEFARELDAAEGAGSPDLTAEIATLERRKKEQKAKLDALADHPEVDAGVAVLALASFDRKITELRARRAASADLRHLRRMVGLSREQWEDESLDARSTTIRSLFVITVLPTRQRGLGFDPRAVRVERRPLPQAETQVDKPEKRKPQA